MVRLLTNPRGQQGIALLTLLGLLLFNVFFYGFVPYIGLEVYREDQAGEVFFVQPGGPAEAAGVAVGDIVLAIDGRPVDPARSEPRFRPGVRPGDQVVFELQRGPRVVSALITIGSAWENLAWLGAHLGGQLLSIGLWLPGMLLVWFTAATDYRARLLGLGLLLAGLTAAVGGASGWNSLWGANTLQLVLLTWLGPILVAAHLTFPLVSLGRFRRPLINLFTTVSILLSLMLVLTGWIWTTSFSVTVGRELRRMVLIYFLLAWLLSLVLLIWNRFKSQEPEIRRQTGIVLWGLTLGLGPFLLLTVLPYLLFGQEIVTGRYAILCLLLLPLAYLYVIFQRRLLRLDMVINRLVVFFVQSLLLLGLAGLLFGGLVLLLDMRPMFAFLGIFGATLLALTAPRLQERVQVKVNQVLYGAHYDFPSVTAGLADQLAETLDRQRLIALLTKNLPSQMGIGQVALLLVEGDQLGLQTGDEDPFMIDLDDNISRHLGAVKEPVRAESIWEQFPGAIQGRWARFAWARLLVPLVLEGQMRGLLILGARVSGDIYSDQDVQIIATVAQQSAMALANIQLVEELRGLTQQLVRVDEAQRKRLTRELHDTVLQDLFFIKQRQLRDSKSDESTDLLDTTIRTLRGVIKAQRPALLDQGLVLALQGLIQDMQQMVEPAPAISWQCKTTEALILSDERATSVYRIAQEALTNALKHAQASQIAVKLEQVVAGKHRLVIEDDGSGLPALASDRGSKDLQFGIAGMRERARMIEGRLQLEPRPEGGTRLALEFEV